MWNEKNVFFNLLSHKSTINLFLSFISILNLGTQFLVQMSDQ